MKNLANIVFILTIILLKTEIAYSQIKVAASDVDFIEVIHPVDDIILWTNQKDTLYSNGKNEFFFKKEITKPQFARVIIGNTFLRTILLPNKTIQIAKLDSSYQFVGDNSTGMKFLNEMNIPLPTFQEAEKFRNDTAVSQIQSRIAEWKQKDLNELSQLIEIKEIDKALAGVLMKEIDYLYALRTQQVILSTQTFEKPIHPDLLELFANTLSKYPLSTDYKPEYWNEYAKISLIDKPFNISFAQKFTSLDSARKVYDEGRHHAFRYNHALAYDSQEIVEKVLANYLMTELKQGGFEKRGSLTIFVVKFKYARNRFLRAAAVTTRFGR